ncbi:MAG: SDR family NAD(P)-dependent oxidoreductase [Lachnospiraceae bacterium]|nr:SDR family NAD(P)-dependent oxidoreductase [Lachnospiraceae bacterium]
MKRCAFITGASRGIGKAIAIALAKDGYDLYLVCKNSENQLLQLKKELENQFCVSITCLIGDVSSFSFIESCFSKIDHLDVLINNAGISYIGLLSEMSPDEWDRVISTNLSSAFYTSKCAIPMMLQKHCGKIINISSVWGNVGASTEVAYSASKGGLNAFTKALAKELAPSNIQVNAIACGVIDTEMNSCFNKEEMDSLIEEIPSDRLGRSQEVAQMVLRLLDSPAYLTGQVITLDGGWQ